MYAICTEIYIDQTCWYMQRTLLEKYTVEKQVARVGQSESHVVLVFLKNILNKYYECILYSQLLIKQFKRGNVLTPKCSIQNLKRSSPFRPREPVNAPSVGKKERTPTAFLKIVYCKAQWAQLFMTVGQKTVGDHLPKTNSLSFLFQKASPQPLWKCLDNENVTQKSW